ncbi:hypothetical protein KFK09_003492 [Dendrobium nobile]|uniref:Uncharacterized protein n=2 Tax=Dendrobium nobile TaxID=94219 RepID=A0A8T3C3M4_DENNO|nr:hypothetical protein KFK09_003492 [Dendrobium nobile]
MAVVTESFSIREYTERMRSIDLRRCWPFEGESEGRCLLPSISVRRFKWWADELSSARSMVIVEGEDDRSKDAVVVATLGADDILRPTRMDMEPSAVPIAGEEVRRTSKGKQRTPKKRSIVELFAAAPLIAGRVDVDEASSDEDERWEEEDAFDEDKEQQIDVVIRKKKAMKDNVIKKKKRRKKKKNKGIKDGLKLEICALEKDKFCKPKMISSAQSCKFRNPVCSKKSKKTTRSSVESQKQPAKEKVVGKKLKILRTSMLLSRNQEVAKKPPVRSILKNQKRGTADRKSSKAVGAKAANLIKFYCKSNKHVTFSVKDDMVGNNSACSSMDFPQLQNLCKIFSDVLAASSAMNHSSKSHDLPEANDKPQEANACEKGTHSSVVSRIEASSTEKNQSSDSIVNLCQPTVVNSSNSSCSGTEKASFAVMLDLNHAVDANDIDCGIPATSTLSASCIYSGDPNSRVSFSEKNLNSTSDIHLEAGLPRSSEPSLVLAPDDKFVASSNVTSSMTLLKNPSSHSSTSCLISYNKANERQCQPHVDADVNFYHQHEEHQSVGHRSPNGMLGNLRYSMGSKKSGEYLFNPNSVSNCRSKCPGEDFIGLPLNSQGELIQFHSGTKFTEAYNKQNMEWGSSHNFSANRHVESNGRMNYLEIMRKKVAGATSYQKNQSDWNQKPCYSTRERVRHWLNFAELEGSERLEIQKNEPMKGKDIFIHCNSNPRSHSFDEYTNGEVPHDFCDRVDYHSQPAVQPTVRLMGKNVVVSGINRDCNGFNNGRTWNNNENLADRTQWMQREGLSHPTTMGTSKGNLLELLDSTPKFYRMKALEPTLDYINITQQPQWTSTSNDPAVLNHNFKLDMNKHALPPQTFMNKATQFLGNCIPGEGSITTGHHYPAIVASHPPNFHEQMLLSSSHCKHNQKVPTTQSQFKYQDYGKLSQPPLLHPASKLPQWLLHAEHQKRTQLSDTAISQPCNVSGTNSNYHLSPYQVPVIPFSSRSNTDRRNGPFVSNACTPSIISLATATGSSGNVSKRNISIKKKERDGTYSKSTTFKNPSDAQKLVKRPAHFDDDGMINSAKRPLKGQADSQVPAEPNETEQINELDLQRTANEKGLCRNVNSSNSGPTKLIAGAKHILKPCHRTDEENCRPIHSIILPATNAPGKLFGPKKKISNIYNF